MKIKILPFLILISIALFPVALTAKHRPMLTMKKQKGAALQAIIQANPVPASPENAEKIYPGTSIKLTATINNLGTKRSAPGKAFIQFSFPKPLDTHEKSLLFQTEEVTLPSIPPKGSVELTFSTTHRWPTLFDFVRDDWGMRSYQLRANINEVEKVLGTLAISFSAYYYATPAHPLPTSMPEASK